MGENLEQPVFFQGGKPPLCPGVFVVKTDYNPVHRAAQFHRQFRKIPAMKSRIGNVGKKDRIITPYHPPAAPFFRHSFHRPDYFHGGRNIRLKDFRIARQGDHRIERVLIQLRGKQGTGIPRPKDQKLRVLWF